MERREAHPEGAAGALPAGRRAPGRHHPAGQLLAEAAYLTRIAQIQIRGT